MKQKVEELLETMFNIDNIRLISILDFGFEKSEITWNLQQKFEVKLYTPFEQRYTDRIDRIDQEDKQNLQRINNIKLIYNYIENQKMEQYLFDVMIFPDYIDQSQIMISNFRMFDGALLIVDITEGVSFQLQQFIRQASYEKIKLVLMIDKVDKAICELKQNGETIYQNFLYIIDTINIILNQFQTEQMGNLLVRPEMGAVSFGSGKEGWAFSITRFARIYSSKFKVEACKLQERFWGENYFDAEGKCWRKDNISGTGKQLKRAFVAFIMEPIIKLTTAITQGNKDVLNQMLAQIALKMTQEELKLEGKHLLNAVMSKWINAADTLLEMMVIHLPSPRTAQKYRTAYLYEGPQDDPIAQSMRECNPKGPLLMYISKMVPTSDRGRFFAFGRIFSGTAGTGQKVRIMGPNYKPGKKEDFFEKSIQRMVLTTGKDFQFVPEVSCGNIVGITGIDQYLTNTGTISDHPDAQLIRSIKSTKQQIVSVEVQPQNPQKLPILINGLKKLQKQDTSSSYIMQEGGEQIIGGCNELHVKILIQQLEELSQIEIIKSEPFISYKETVTATSSIVCMTKSPNKHNKIFAQACPLDQRLIEQIEKDYIGENDDLKKRATQLEVEFDWDRQDALKIWSFGPQENILVNKTVGVHNINEVRDSMESAWKWVTKEGVLCEENMRGVRMNILDFESHADAIHRGGGQIIPSTRRLYYACELTAQPRLQEPIFLVEITTQDQIRELVYKIITLRKGIIIEEKQVFNSAFVHAVIPAAQFFGFYDQLRDQTQGQAFCISTFDHWENINSDPLQDGSLVFFDNKLFMFKNQLLQSEQEKDFNHRFLSYKIFQIKCDHGIINKFVFAYFNKWSEVDPKNVFVSIYALYPLDPNITKLYSPLLLIDSTIVSMTMQEGFNYQYYHYLFQQQYQNTSNGLIISFTFYLIVLPNYSESKVGAKQIVMLSLESNDSLIAQSSDQYDFFDPSMSTKNLKPLLSYLEQYFFVINKGILLKYTEFLKVYPKMVTSCFSPFLP